MSKISRLFRDRVWRQRSVELDKASLACCFPIGRPNELSRIIPSSGTIRSAAFVYQNFEMKEISLRI